MIQKKIKRRKKIYKQEERTLQGDHFMQESTQVGQQLACFPPGTTFSLLTFDEDIHRPINAFEQTLLLVLYVKLRGRKWFLWTIYLECSSALYT